MKVKRKANTRVTPTHVALVKMLRDQDVAKVDIVKVTGCSLTTQHYMKQAGYDYDKYLAIRGQAYQKKVKKPLGVVKATSPLEQVISQLWSAIEALESISKDGGK